MGTTQTLPKPITKPASIYYFKKSERAMKLSNRKNSCSFYSTVRFAIDKRSI
jgi:hypothetical protein